MPIKTAAGRALHKHGATTEQVLPLGCHVPHLQRFFCTLKIKRLEHRREVNLSLTKPMESVALSPSALLHNSLSHAGDPQAIWNRNSFSGFLPLFDRRSKQTLKSTPTYGFSVKVTLAICRGVGRGKRKKSMFATV